MKKTLKKYNHNTDNNTLEVTYELISESGTRLTIKEIVEYSKAKEVRLLGEMRKNLLAELENYYNLTGQNIKMPNLLHQEYTITSLSLLMQTPFSLVLGGLFAGISVIDTKRFIKSSLELKKIEKGAYFISSEEEFKKINEHLGFVGCKIKSSAIKRKLNNLSLKNETINENNINEFTIRQLKKINKFYDKNLI